MSDPLRVLSQVPTMAKRKTHAELYAERAKLDEQGVPKDDPRQMALAAQEHRAFAREWTKENPLVAVPSLLAGIPMYAMAKKLGMRKKATPTSLDQVAESYRGIWDGLSEH